jgi:hypothetical protein
MVVHGLDGALPLVLVVGDPGTGKSSLLQSVAERLGVRAQVLLVAGAAASFETIVARALASLGVPVIDEPLILQIRRLADRLLAARHEGRRLILMIDDADRLDVHTLLELRLLLAPSATGNALLPLALAGSPALRQRLAEPPLTILGGSVLLEVTLERRAAREEKAPPAPAVIHVAPLHVETPDAEVAEDVERGPGEDAVFLPAVLDVHADPTRPVGRWALAAATAMLGATLAFVGIRKVPEWEAPVARATPRAETRPLPAQPPPAPAAVPLGPREGPVSADEARAAVNAFRQAVALGDVPRLRRLLAPDAAQHELRGRAAIIEAYAYRFERATPDSETEILAPQRVVLRDAGAVVTTPFVAWYRDAAGRPGTLAGTTRWRIVRQRGRPVVAQIDYEYGLLGDE